ncbi:MAG: pilus assembly protein [Actinomycetota bacterium]|nr:pilus assembly protein [Actinomycetota bacterium]
MRIIGSRDRLRREDGAAAVEFALIVGLLAMLIFGMMEYGLAFWQLQTLRSAAREGARVAAVGGTQAQIRTSVSNNAGFAVPQSGLTICSSVCNTGTQTEKYCGLPGQAIDRSVTVQLVNANLPTGIKNIFKIDIPLLPSITLTPVLSGTFRCEGTSG